MTQVFTLPDVGEGLTEAEIVSWKVKPGDTVGVNDMIVEIETAKSLVELPTPYAGTVAELLVREGQTIEVGAPIMRIASEGVTASETTTGPNGAATGATSATGTDTTAEPERTSMLVGYGPRTGTRRRRARRPAEPPAPGEAPVSEAPVEPAEPAEPAAPAEPAEPAEPTEPEATTPVLAKPPVRKLAKQLGVDLRQISPSGPGGVVTREDVEAFARAEPSAADVTEPTGGVRETRVPIKGVRKHTAEAMVASAFTAPHVSEWVTLDVTATMELVGRLAGRPEFADLKVSPLLVVAKACLLAIRRTPEANASWDESTREIVMKHGVNLGIAAATSRGLIVPNVKGADQLSLVELCRALGEVTRTARDGKTTPQGMQQTTFTITNVGVFGVDGGTPILNPGTSAILAMGAIDKRPWVVDDEIVPRWVMTLAVSFDHRIVDGEQGSRFLADVAAILRDPGATLLYT